MEIRIRQSIPPIGSVIGNQSGTGERWASGEKLKLGKQKAQNGGEAEMGKGKADFGPHSPRCQRLSVAHANGQENAHPDFVLENGTRIEDGWRGLL
jgi:hypothetical protein